ncbi:MAG: hypothetical protein WAM14_03245 [Candidatus Nitrosopolaris sp.]
MGKSETLVSPKTIYLLFLLSVMTTFANFAYAQPSENGTQFWTDTENNVKILFTYSPKNPVIDTQTELKFSVSNLLTGKHLKNLMAMVVIITNSTGQERTFKFNNLYAPNGDFSVKYLFPDSSIYQVITRINSNNPPSIMLASFSVIVTPEISSLSFIITLVIIIAIIVGSATYFVRTKWKHHLNKRRETFILIASISVLLSVYFFLSLYAFPHLYVTLPKIRPIPVINNVSLSSYVIEIGHSFHLSLTGANNGDSADIQTISVGFPNLTSIDGFVQIRQSDFNQKPLLIKKGEMVRSSYQGAENLISARYPSIEAFSRPWHSQVIHHIELEVKPISVGRFVIFLKSVAFPHLNQFAHYPLYGLRDYQNEFVKAYSIPVVKDEK